MDDLLSRVMAYRFLSETRVQDERLELYAFLSLFYPEKTHKEKMDIVNSKEARW